MPQKHCCPDTPEQVVIIQFYLRKKNNVARVTETDLLHKDKASKMSGDNMQTGERTLCHSISQWVTARTSCVEITISYHTITARTCTMTEKLQEKPFIMPSWAISDQKNFTTVTHKMWKSQNQMHVNVILTARLMWRKHETRFSWRNWEKKFPKSMWAVKKNGRKIH